MDLHRAKASNQLKNPKKYEDKSAKIIEGTEKYAYGSALDSSVVERYCKRLDNSLNKAMISKC